MDGTAGVQGGVARRLTAVPNERSHRCEPDTRDALTTMLSGTDFDDIEGLESGESGLSTIKLWWRPYVDKLRREYPEIAPTGPTYSRAVRVGDTLYVSGCTARGTDAQGGPPSDQLSVTLDRIIRIVEAEGGVPQDIVKITTFVTRMSDWFPASDDQLRLFRQHFGDEPPANSLVEITSLAEPGLDIEIEATVVLG